MTEEVGEEEEAEHPEGGKQTREWRHDHLGTCREDLARQHEPLQEDALGNKRQVVKCE